MHAYRNQQALRRSRPQPALRLPAATRPWCPERSWRGREDRPHPQTGRGHAIHLLWRRRAKGWGRHHCPSPMAAARIGARETRVEGCGDVMRTNGLQTASRISWVGGLSVRSGDSKPDQWGGWSFGGIWGQQAGSVGWVVFRWDLGTASRISWVGGLSVRSGDSKPDQWGGWSFGGIWGQQAGSVGWVVFR